MRVAYDFFVQFIQIRETSINRSVTVCTSWAPKLNFYLFVKIGRKFLKKFDFFQGFAFGYHLFMEISGMRYPIGLGTVSAFVMCIAMLSGMVIVPGNRKYSEQIGFWDKCDVFLRDTWNWRGLNESLTMWIEMRRLTWENMRLWECKTLYIKYLLHPNDFI